MAVDLALEHVSELGVGLDAVEPFSFDAHDVRLLLVLTDRGSEYCGNPKCHEYELFLAIEDIDYSRIKTKSPQTASSSASTRPS
jgi:hypothetical protein